MIRRHTVSLEEIQKMCHRTHNPFACAHWQGNICEIYLPRREDYKVIREKVVELGRPVSSNDLVLELALLGHETKHCFDGAWH